MTKIKDINEGDTVRINGKTYKVKSISVSPWTWDQKITSYILDCEFIEDDFGETLADLAKLGERK